MSPELSRIVSVDKLPAAVTVEASAAECVALATRLRIPAVESLHCRYTLTRIGDVVAAIGVLQARVVQSCVVSLEDVAQDVGERFALRFVPAGQERHDEDPDEPDELPYAGVQIDLGEATAEQLALSLDPYPRHPDAVLDPGAQDDSDLDGNPAPRGLAALRSRLT